MGNRPDRVGEAIRDELSQLLARQVHDPGIGFITLTRVSVTPDLQLARVYYTSLGDDKAQGETARALQRASPFLRRQLGARIRLRRVPELSFFYDESSKIASSRSFRISGPRLSRARERQRPSRTSGAGPGPPRASPQRGTTGRSPPVKPGKE